MFERAGNILHFIRLELRPFPGRTDALIRYLVCMAVLILVSITLDVPFLMLSLIIVFFTVMENTSYTALAGILILIGGTVIDYLAIIPLLAYTLDYPLARIIVANAIVFASMYFFRASALGFIGFMAALSIIFSQSIYDLFPYPEPILRSTMWSWVAMGYSAAVCILINFWVLPAKPERLLKEEADRQLDKVIGQINARLHNVPPPEVLPVELERGIASLHTSLKFLGGKEDNAILAVRLGVIEKLSVAAAFLARYPSEKIAGYVEKPLRELKEACTAFQRSLRENIPFRMNRPIDFENGEETGVTGQFRKMSSALSFFSQGAEINGSLPSVKEKASIFVPDAFSNPGYVRFAFKTTLATFIGYTFYTAVQWEGIHTCMLTCILLALPSLGEIKQKAILRVTGCAAGSLLTLAAVVFIVPHLESIAGFLLLGLAIMGMGAWIAIGSPRTNYAGVQLAFAYMLAMCEKYSMDINLTEIRDRLIGILVGIIISTVIYTFIWPEKGGDSTPKYLKKLFLSLSQASDPSLTREKSALGWQHSLADIRACREHETRLTLAPSWKHAQNNLREETEGILCEAEQFLLSSQQVRQWLDAPERRGNSSLQSVRNVLREYSEAVKDLPNRQTLPELPDLTLVRKETGGEKTVEHLQSIASSLNNLHAKTKNLSHESR